MSVKVAKERMTVSITIASPNRDADAAVERDVAVIRDADLAAMTFALVGKAVGQGGLDAGACLKRAEDGDRCNCRVRGRRSRHPQSERANNVNVYGLSRSLQLFKKLAAIVVQP